MRMPALRAVSVERWRVLSGTAGAAAGGFASASIAACFPASHPGHCLLAGAVLGAWGGALFGTPFLVAVIGATLGWLSAMEGSLTLVSSRPIMVSEAPTSFRLLVGFLGVMVGSVGGAVLGARFCSRRRS